MPTPEQIAEYQRMKSEGEIDNLPPEKSAFLKKTYEPLVNPVSKTETALRHLHQGVTGMFQDELAGIGSVIGNSMSTPSALMSLVNPTLGMASIANDLISDLVKGDETSQSILENYRKGRDEARAKNEYAQKSNPKTAIAANIVGGIAPSMILPGSQASLLPRLVASAATGGVFGAGMSDADLTQGNVGDFSKDVALMSALGPVLDLGLMGVGKTAVGLSKTAPARAILTKADEMLPRIGSVVKSVIPSISESGRTKIAANKLKQQFETETIDQFVKKNGGKIDDVMAQKAAAQGFPVQDAASLNNLVVQSKASKEAGQSGILRSAVMPPKEIPVPETNVTQQNILDIKPSSQVGSVGKISHWIKDGPPGLSIESHPDHEGWGSVIFRNKDGSPVGEMSFIKEENGFVSGEKGYGGINHIYVDPEYQRQGIATKMVNYAKENNLGDINGALLNQPKSENGAAFVRNYFDKNKPGITPERAAQIKTQSLSDFVDSQGGFSQKTVDAAIEQGFQIEDRTVANLKRLYAVDQGLKNEGKEGILRSEQSLPNQIKNEIFDKFQIKPLPTTTEVLPDTPGLAKEVQSEYASGVPGLENAKVPVPNNPTGTPTLDNVNGLNLKNVGPDDVRAVVQQAAQHPDNAALYSNKPMSREEILALADEQGLDADRLLKSWEKGDAWNRQEMAVVTRYLNDARENINKVVRTADISTKEGLEAYKKEVLDYYAKESLAYGGASEAGATLRMRANPNAVNSKGLTSKQMQNLERLLSNPREAKWLQDFAKSLDPKDKTSLIGYIDNATKPFWKSVKGAHYYTAINGALSWIATHKTNFLSNAFKLAERPFITSAQAGVSLLKPLIGKPRTTYVGEAVAEVAGMSTGIKLAVKNALNAFVKNQSKYGGVSKFGVTEGVRRFAPRIPGVNPKIIEYGIGTPGKALLGSDEAFKTLHYSASIMRTAYRNAMNDLKSGKINSWQEGVRKYLKNPTKEMIEEAMDDAQRFTFTSPLGKDGKSAVAAIQKVRGLKYIQLFTTTPINIWKSGKDYTPLGYLSAGLNRNAISARKIEEKLIKATLGSIALVGPKFQGPAEYERLSKLERQGKLDPKAISLASFINGGLMQLYAEGGITGGAPRDLAQRELFYKNHQPNSILLERADGTKYWKSFMIEPFGTFVGMYLDAMQADKRMNEKDNALAITGGMMANMGNRSFMMGLSNLFDAYSRPETLEKFGGDLAFLTTMPWSSTVRGVANLDDPVLRKSETLAQRYQSQLPSMKAKLPPMIDFFGKPISFEGTSMNKISTTLRERNYDDSPLMGHIQRLGFKPSSVTDDITSEMELTPEKLTFLQIAKGTLFKKYADKMISLRKDFTSLPKTKQLELLEKQDVKARKNAIKAEGLLHSRKSLKKTMRALMIANEKGDYDSVERLNDRVQKLMSGGYFEFTRRGEVLMDDIEGDQE